MFCPTCHGEYPETWKVCPKDATPMLASAKIGKYAITAPLGIGGMGAVYRAKNPDTQGEVALKVMHADVAASESARARFKREAAAIAKLKTSHVVKVYDFGADPDGTLYLVMELLDGHTLRDEIHAPPDTMTFERAQFVMDGVLKGLSAAHKIGIVHRDLKPENVYLSTTDDGEVPRLLDFGIARIDEPGDIIRSGATTRPGMVMGTAVYMAPEQLQGLISKVGTWSDVYAIGAMLYEMLGGKTQVTGGTLAEVLTQVLRAKHEPLAKLRPDLPPAFCAIVQQCLAIEPARRPQNADELRTALAAVWGQPFPSIQPSGARRAKTPTSGVAPTHVSDEPVDQGAMERATVPETPRAQAVAVGVAPTIPSEEAPVPAPPAKRVSPLIPFAMLIFVIVVGSLLWMLTH